MSNPSPSPKINVLDPAKAVGNSDVKGMTAGSTATSSGSAGALSVSDTKINEEGS
jgi:hypothetical protein